MALKDVKTWMYQLQGVENTGAVAALAGSGYDMLVVEPTATVKGCQGFDMKGMVGRFHAGKGGRVVLAYIDIGEAESYRTYWRSTWRAPKNNNPGSPDFILRADPDGWAENFVVAYWDQRWQLVLANELVKIMNAGFDGIYLDWVDGYEDAAVLAEAKRQHVDPAAAMIDFIASLRTTARKANPKAVVIAQNAPYLLDEDARYANVIDGLAMEDIWFRGRPDAGWNSPAGGDIPNRWNDEYSTAALVKQCKKYLAAGKAVFTVDYCLKPAHAAQVYRDSAKAGLTPLVTRVSLAKITTTPPPALK
jgi:cysteinyl-tRNA synthetase